MGPGKCNTFSSRSHKQAVSTGSLQQVCSPSQSSPPWAQKVLCYQKKANQSQLQKSLLLHGAFWRMALPQTWSHRCKPLHTHHCGIRTDIPGFAGSNQWARWTYFQRDHCFEEKGPRAAGATFCWRGQQRSRISLRRSDTRRPRRICRKFRQLFEENGIWWNRFGLGISRMVSSFRGTIHVPNVAPRTSLRLQESHLQPDNIRGCGRFEINHRSQLPRRPDGEIRRFCVDDGLRLSFVQVVFATHRPQLAALSARWWVEHVQYCEPQLDRVLLDPTGNAQRKIGYRFTNLRPNISVRSLGVQYFDFIQLILCSFFARLYNPSFHGLYAPAIGAGTVGMGGQISYPVVCQFLANGGIREFDGDSRVPFAYHKRSWISYDDEQSLEEKVLMKTIVPGLLN